MVASELTGREQEVRTVRAAVEGGDYQWVKKDAFYICETAKGSVYQVQDGGCSCADWQYRGSKTGALCKHQIALGQKKLADGDLS